MNSAAVSSAAVGSGSVGFEPAWGSQSRAAAGVRPQPKLSMVSRAQAAREKG